MPYIFSLIDKTIQMNQKDDQRKNYLISIIAPPNLLSILQAVHEKMCVENS